MNKIKAIILALALIVSIIVGYTQISFGQSGQYCSTWNGHDCVGDPSNCMCPIIIEPPQ